VSALAALLLIAMAFYGVSNGHPVEAQVLALLAIACAILDRR